MTNSTAKKMVQVGQIVRNRYSQAIAKVISVETGDNYVAYFVRTIGGESQYWGSEYTCQLSASDAKFYARHGNFRGN